MPQLIGIAISHRLATLKELETYYSMEDLLDMIEVITIDAHNRYG